MPFKKLGPDRYQGPTGKIFNRKQVKLYYSLGGHFPGQKNEQLGLELLFLGAPKVLKNPHGVKDIAGFPRTTAWPSKAWMDKFSGKKRVKSGKELYIGPKRIVHNMRSKLFKLGKRIGAFEDCAPPTNNMGSGHISGANEKAPILFRKLKKVLRRKRNNIHEGSERDPFITDSGREMPVTDVKTGKEVMRLKRYGVWAWDPARRKHQVIDTGNDLEQLRKKHNVHPSRFAKLPDTQESAGFPRKPFSWHYFNKKRKKGFDDPNAAGADGNGH